MQFSNASLRWRTVIISTIIALCFAAYSSQRLFNRNGGLQLMPEDVPPPSEAAPPPPPAQPEKVASALPPMPEAPLAEIKGWSSGSLQSHESEDMGALREVIKDRVAVLIESRSLSNLVPLILHFSTVLGPKWPVVLFTSMTSIVNSAALKERLADRNIFILPLPKDLEFKTHFDVSKFLTKPWFWNQLAPADHVLLFQTDSVICANSKLRVEDFFEYDLIGAPITPAQGNGYNGGLSLRSRKLLLEVIDTWDFEAENVDPQPNDMNQYEDQWFHNKMVQLPPRTNGAPAANMPSLEVAMTFGVQTIYYDFPLGYHQPHRWQADNMDKIQKWCPEVSLSGTELLACEPPLC